MLAPIVVRFMTHAAPRVELLTFAAAAAGRSYLAATGHGPAWAEALVVLALLGALPFAEWVLHARLLHARPIRLGGRSITLAAARAHCAHHAFPRDERFLVTPLRALVPAGALIVLALAVVPSWSLRATALAVVAVLFLATEWTHYLTHSGVKPRSAWLERRIRTHRMHHYRNDGYWFGLTSGIADAMFGTGPERDRVAVNRRAG